MLRVTTFTMAALLLALVQAPPVQAEGAVSCGGSRGAIGCIWRNGTGNTHVRKIVEPKSEQEKSESAQRERLWVSRCRPRMTVDDLGVQRYAYAAAGCEFGKYQ